MIPAESASRRQLAIVSPVLEIPKQMRLAHADPHPAYRALKIAECAAPPLPEQYYSGVCANSVEYSPVIRLCY